MPVPILQIEGCRCRPVRDKAYRGGQARSGALHEAREGEDRKEQEDGRGAQDFRRQQGAAGPLRLKLLFFIFEIVRVITRIRGGDNFSSPR